MCRKKRQQEIPCRRDSTNCDILRHRGHGERVALLGVGQGGDAAGEGGLVDDALGDGIGHVDLVPVAADVDLVPGVVAAAGVALGEGAGDVLAAAHGGEEGREVVADALVAVQGGGGVGDVLADLAGGDVVSELGVVGVVTGDVVVNRGDLVHVGLGVLAERGGLLAHIVTGGELHIGRGDEVRGVGVFDLGVDLLAGHDAVGRAGDVLAEGDGVGAVALLEGEDGVLAARAVFVRRLFVTVLDADLQFGIGGIVDGDETILGIRGVNGGAIGSAGVHNREHGHDNKHCEHSAGMTKQPFHTAISFR